MTPFVYGEAATGKPLPPGPATVTRVALRHGTLACSLDVVGPPQVATADGEHVLVVFFAATDGPFQLVATWLDVP